MTSPRMRLQDALDGKPVTHPVYAVYDWFVQHRPHVDWQRMFDLGLGQIHHATLVRHERPHVRIEETTSVDASGQQRRDVRWITDIGELHEWYLGEWLQEHLIKSPEDYRIMARALSDVKVTPDPEALAQTETLAGEQGITLGCTVLRRTPFQSVQIDMAGLEQFSLDIALERPELLELLEIMNDLVVREFEALARTSASHVKLWENLTIETMGPHLFRRHLVPMYRRLFEVLARSGQRLCVHYDGKLRSIAHDICELDFDIDSLTPTPEGDLTVAEARALWPDKFLWLHPPLGWYDMPEQSLKAAIRQMVSEAGGRRFCLMISEEVPDRWAGVIPCVLDALQG